MGAMTEIDRISAKIHPGAGVGFKAQHAPIILSEMPSVAFFEIHAENYMGAGGQPHRLLEAIRRDYPLSVHGVGLSIGSMAPLDADHLERLRQVVDRYEPGLVSEHLAWSTHDGVYLADLLPLPYTQTTLRHVCAHIDEVQTALGRQILLENPSTYLAFAEATLSETQFLREITQRTGCGLLLDINNVFVSAMNHATRPHDYMADFPLDAVGEIHLGGHAEERDDANMTLLIDTHDRPIDSLVWALYRETIAKTDSLPTLIEWDTNVPAWADLFGEAQRAQAILDILCARTGNNRVLA